MEPCGNLYFLSFSIGNTCPFPLFPPPTAVTLLLQQTQGSHGLHAPLASVPPAAAGVCRRAQHPGQRRPSAAVVTTAGGLPQRNRDVKQKSFSYVLTVRW